MSSLTHTHPTYIYMYKFKYSGLRVDGTDPKRWFIWTHLKDILGFAPSTLNPLYVYIIYIYACVCPLVGPSTGPTYRHKVRALQFRLLLAALTSFCWSSLLGHASRKEGQKGTKKGPFKQTKDIQTNVQQFWQLVRLRGSLVRRSEASDATSSTKSNERGRVPCQTRGPKKHSDERSLVARCSDLFHPLVEKYIDAS